MAALNVKSITKFFVGLAMLIATELHALLHVALDVIAHFAPRRPQIFFWWVAPLLRAFGRRRATVELQPGAFVRGVDDGTAVSFTGIPYAAPSRFEAPSLISSYRDACRTLRPRFNPFWLSDVVNAAGRRWAPVVGSLTFAALEQPISLGVLKHLHARWFNKGAWGDERRCCQVNVWTPSGQFDSVIARAEAEAYGFTSAIPNAPLLPVFVYIHGGGYNVWSSHMPLHDGAKLAKTANVVVVSVEYRQGILGFANFKPTKAGGPAGAAPNVGVLDCAVALEWVQKYAKCFGGDPARVTVGGESAGAMITSILMTIPRAQGLFRNAVLMSGVGDWTMTRADAAANLEYFGTALGLDDPSDQAAVYTAMRKCSLGRLMQIQNKLVRSFEARFKAFESEPQQLLTFGPIVDGTVIPRHVYDALIEDPSLSRGRTVLTCTTTNEYMLFLKLGVPKRGQEYNDQRLSSRLTHLMGDIPCPPTLARRIVYKYDSTREGWRFHCNDAVKGNWSQAVSDILFRIPSEIFATHVQQNGGAAVVARFAEPSPISGFQAAHAVDLHYWFGNRRVGPFLAGLFGGVEAEQRFEKLSREMMRLVAKVCRANHGGAMAHENGRSNGLHATASGPAASPTCTEPGAMDEMDLPLWRGDEPRARGPILVLGDPEGRDQDAAIPLLRVARTTEDYMPGDNERTAVWAGVPQTFRWRAQIASVIS